jgi:anti-sigma regulatory factor (Ser/Thr protein kinase)
MEKRVLIARWLGSDVQPIPIYDEASVSSARQLVRQTGQQLNLKKELVENVALLSSELTHNQLAHSKQGYFAVRPIERHGVKGLEVIAADLGPGIERPGFAIVDGASTRDDSLGSGLGAVCRIADEVEFDNRIAEGVCIIARKFDERPESLWCEIAIMGKPYPGEVISGDDGSYFQNDAELVAGVADGLGHGPEAREASNRAIDVLGHRRGADPGSLLIDLNQELIGTRGCVMGLMCFHKRARVLECAMAGDVFIHLYNLRNAHFFTPTPFVLGTGQLPKQRIRIEQATVAPGSVAVMFTDGLTSRTTLKGDLDVLRQPAIAIAEHLIEKHSRPDDDALVLVAKL